MRNVCPVRFFISIIELNILPDFARESVTFHVKIIYLNWDTLGIQSNFVSHLFNIYGLCVSNQTVYFEMNTRVVETIHT